MIKPQHIAVFFLLVSCISISVLLMLKENPASINPIKKNNFPEGIGAHDDPEARMNYEKKRLVDPLTGKIPADIRAGELAFAKTLPKKNDGGRSSLWTSRGPHNVGGRTRALAFDVTNENIMLAGGVTGGMWRTTNGGNSFTKVTEPDQFHSVTCIAQDKRVGKTNIWYYGTGEYYGVISAASFSNQASGNGIFKSVNGGLSWQPLTSTTSNSPTTLYANRDFDFVWNIVTDHTDTTNDVVCAAVINGIFKSMDGGQSWIPTLGLDSGATSLSHYTNIMITPSGIFYATIGSGSNKKGLWRSTDGDNWVNITPAGWPNTFRRTVMAIVPNDENKIYFLTETPGTGALAHTLWYYSYLSGDGSGAGGSWENRSANLPDFKCEVFYDFTFGSYRSQNSYDMAIAVKPDDENVVFLGGIDVHRSTDGFQTNTNTAWIGGYQCDTVTPSNYIYPNHHPDLHYFLFLPSNPNIFFTASDGGIHKTTDCLASTVQWQSLNNGYVTSQFYTIAFEPGETSNDILVGGLQDNGTYFTNNSNSIALWKHVFYGDGAYAAIPEGRRNYYLSWQTGKTFKFEMDNNGNINGLTRIDPVGGTGYQFINPFILNPANDNVMFLAAGRYLWRHNNLDSIPVIGNEDTAISMGWEKLIPSLITGGSLSNPREISALAMSPSNDNTIYYGTNDGQLFRLDSLRSSPLKTSLNNSIFPANAYISCISVNPLDFREVFLSFSNYKVKSIFHSTDAGTTWENISGNLEENLNGTGNGPSVMWVEMLDLQDSVIYYAGTSIGLFSTTLLNDSATIWEQEGAGTIGNVVINMIKTRSHDGLVAVATHGNGIYSTRHREISSARNKESQSLISLEQNIPNPFSGSTQFNYSVFEKTQASLSIFTLDGKIIKRLMNRTHLPGNYSLMWDGRNEKGNTVSSGIYFYQLSTERNSITKKLVYQR